MRKRNYGEYGLDVQEEGYGDPVERRRPEVCVIRKPEEKRGDPLDVVVAAEFKPLLLQRFDLERARKVKGGSLWRIKGSCVLCAKYRRGRNCGECPFKRFRRGRRFGCEIWLDKVLERARIYNFLPVIDRDGIFWSTDPVSEDYARQQLGTLRDMIVNRKLFISFVGKEEAE